MGPSLSHPGEGNKAFVFHGLDDALALLTRSQSENMILTTAPGASAWQGAAYFMALLQQIAAAFPSCDTSRIVYDCGNRPGDVLAGLRAGIKCFAMDEGACPVALQALAAKYNAVISSRVNN